MMCANFRKPELLKGVYEMGFNTPSKIQVCTLYIFFLAIKIMQMYLSLFVIWWYFCRNRHCPHYWPIRHRIWSLKANPVRAKPQHSCWPCWAGWIRQRTILKSFVYPPLTNWPYKLARWQPRCRNFVRFVYGMRSEGKNVSVQWKWN